MNPKRLLITLVCFFTLASAFYSGMMFQRARSAKLRLEVIESMRSEGSREEREHQQALKELRDEQQILTEKLKVLSVGKGTNGILEPPSGVGPGVYHQVRETNHSLAKIAPSFSGIEQPATDTTAANSDSAFFRDLLDRRGEASIEPAEAQMGFKVDSDGLGKFMVDLETFRAELPVEASGLYQKRAQAAFKLMNIEFIKALSRDELAAFEGSPNIESVYSKFNQAAGMVGLLILRAEQSTLRPPKFNDVMNRPRADSSP
jgi:hypothetical protein